MDLLLIHTLNEPDTVGLAPSIVSPGHLPGVFQERPRGRTEMHWDYTLYRHLAWGMPLDPSGEFAEVVTSIKNIWASVPKPAATASLMQIRGDSSTDGRIVTR